MIRIEETHHNETIFNVGDPPEKFFVILTGSVEVTETLVTKDGRETSVIANLKKGHAFGETSILNDKRRNATCVSVTPCVLLTVAKEDFLAAVGSHFAEQKRETMSFLMHRVAPFRHITRDSCLALLRFSMRMEYPADSEWDIYREKHVYFLRSGMHASLRSCALP